MKLKSRDHKEHIAQWASDHADEIPRNPDNVAMVATGNYPWISDGTKHKDWKRVLRVTIKGQIHRVFEPECTTIARAWDKKIREHSFRVMTTEENGQIIRVLPGITRWTNETSSPHPTLKTWTVEHGEPEFVSSDRSVIVKFKKLEQSYGNGI